MESLSAFTGNSPPPSQSSPRSTGAERGAERHRETDSHSDIRKEMQSSPRPPPAAVDDVSEEYERELEDRCEPSVFLPPAHSLTHSLTHCACRLLSIRRKRKDAQISALQTELEGLKMSALKKRAREVRTRRNIRIACEF